MYNISIKLRQVARKWLGLDESFMGVDLGFRDQSCIVIISRLKDGQVRIIDARFDSVLEIEHLVRELQYRYGIPDRNVFRDYPPGIKRYV